VYRVLCKREARHIPGRAAVDSWRRGGSVCTCWVWFQDARSHEIKSITVLIVEEVGPIDFDTAAERCCVL
jgi:hypothetical protein